MELGQRLKQARLEAGLSQRQLCGDEITRNMLSQIENGTAKPSMATLSYLAGRLGKTVGWFLDEKAEEHAAAAEAYSLLEKVAKAMADGRDIYAAELLGRIRVGDGDIFRRKLLLQAKLPGANLGEICRELPSLDEELLLRARASLEEGNFSRCRCLLDAAEDGEGGELLMLRGELCLRQQDYTGAAECFHKAEAAYPAETAEKLEQCYREIGNFKQAYFYACKQKK